MKGNPPAKMPNGGIELEIQETYSMKMTKTIRDGIIFFTNLLMTPQVGSLSRMLQTVRLWSVSTSPNLELKAKGR